MSVCLHGPVMYVYVCMWLYVCGCENVYQKCLYVFLYFYEAIINLMTTILDWIC